MFCAQQGVPARIFKKSVEKVELTNEIKVATSYCTGHKKVQNDVKNLWIQILLFYIKNTAAKKTYMVIQHQRKEKKL